MATTNLQMNGQDLSSIFVMKAPDVSGDIITPTFDASYNYYAITTSGSITIRGGFGKQWSCWTVGGGGSGIDYKGGDGGSGIFILAYLK